MENQPAATYEQSRAIQQAYQYFNFQLFDGSLPDCFLNFSRLNNNRTMGFFTPAKWEERDGNEDGQPLHEISLCPAWLNRDVREVMSTLVHEMVHLWQQEFGVPSRRGYHNKEWARKMVAVGLFPSDIGKPGGKMTGQRMSHYVLLRGPFDRAFGKMPEAYQLPFVYTEAYLPAPVAAGDDEEGAILVARLTRRKVKYSCAACQVNVWGKPELNLCCGECNQQLIMQL